MRIALIALAIAAFPVCALAQTAPQPVERAVTISLPISQWNIVLQCLGKQPLETTVDTYEAIKAQAANQLNPPAATDDKKKEPKK